MFRRLPAARLLTEKSKTSQQKSLPRSKAGVGLDSGSHLFDE